MRKFTQVFFIVGSFIFLYWFMPEALRDNRVTLYEMILIGINVLNLLVNLSNFVNDLILKYK